MAKLSVLDVMKTKMITPAEFHFDSLMIPPMECFLTYYDIQELHSIATSIKLSSNIKAKYKMIDDIMRPRGFKRFSAGTNRVVYSYLEDPTFLAKIAVDKVGMQDNPEEFKNQQLLKPYVAKMFYISPCGTVGFAERVLPVKNKEEFKQIASDVFDLLVYKILGKYVVEDVGTKYFMNYGVRAGFGPVLLDYPYVYKLDGKKLFCTEILPATNMICDGEIDYDEGFNSLICTRCGKRYLACDLRDKSSNNKIINIKGGNKMKVSVTYGNQVIKETISTDEVMKRRQREEESLPSNLMSVNIKLGNDIIFTSDEKKKTPVANKPKTPEFKKMNVSVNYGNETVSTTKEEPAKEQPIKEETIIKPEVKEETPAIEEVAENISENDIVDENGYVSIEDDGEEDGDYEAADSSIIDGLIDNTSQSEPKKNDAKEEIILERRETNWTAENVSNKYNKHGSLADKIK